MLRQLDDKTLISGQIGPDDVPALKEQGVTMIVVNRPDCEERGQPLAADVEAAAEEAGIAYRFIPIVRGIGPSDAEAMQEAIEAAGDGKLLAYCKSGTRSGLTWAVAKRKAGMPREEIERLAGEAGLDLTPVSHLL